MFTECLVLIGGNMVLLLLWALYPVFAVRTDFDVDGELLYCTVVRWPVACVAVLAAQLYLGL